MMKRWWNGRVLAVAVMVGPLVGACVGSIGEGDETRVEDPTLQPASDSIGETTRFARLTHTQWENTIRELFGFDDGTTFSAGFRSDARSGTYLFDNDTVVLSVDEALMGGYQSAAADVAQAVVADATIFDAIVPAGNDDDARARAFITEFGERVYRRPLLADEVEAHFVLYQEGRDAYLSTTGLEGGIRLVLEGMLVSPYFLYRTELSHDPVNGMVPLNDWEIASRLSYLLWDSMPDDDLFAAARAGQLRDPSALRGQLERMLADPRATEVFARVHSQIFGVAKFDTIGPNPATFPDAPADMVELAKTELELLVADAFESGRSYRDLLTEPRTFVNEDLAPLYGLSAADYGPDFEEVSLDSSERGGVFTLAGFLAANATSNNPDPIHRGLFVSQYLLCNTVPAPPDDIPTLPPPEPDQTNRETIEAMTETSTTCAACHTTVINPYGFPFEMYDASGAVRTEDRGQPLDLATTPTLDGEAIPVSDALDLMEKVAASEEAYLCYAKHVTEYLMGRTAVPKDETLRAHLGAVAAEDASIRDVMVEALSTPQLTHRAIDTVEGGN